MFILDKINNFMGDIYYTVFVEYKYITLTVLIIGVLIALF